MHSMTRLGTILQRELAQHGLTQDEAARRMGVSRFSVSQLIHGRRTLTAPMAVRLTWAFPATKAEWWLRVQMAMDLAAAHKSTRRPRSLRSG